MSIFKYYNLAKNKLFPINRSITGNGLRRTLKIIKKEFPKLKIYKVKSGSKVLYIYLADLDTTSGLSPNICTPMGLSSLVNFIIINVFSFSLIIHLYKIDYMKN